MTFDEFYEILEKVRNGEKAEDLIDFAAPTRANGITPSDVFDLVKDNIYCKECGKKLQGKEMWYCEDCVNKSQEQFSQTNMGEAFDKDNNWTWLMGLMFIASLFSNGDKKE